MKAAIIGVGAVIAAVGVVWAWHDRGKIEGAAERIAKRVVSEFRKDLQYAKREVSSAHKRLDDVEEHLGLHDVKRDLHKPPPKDEGRVAAVEAKLEDLVKQVAGNAAAATLGSQSAHDVIVKLEKRFSDFAANHRHAFDHAEGKE